MLAGLAATAIGEEKSGQTPAAPTNVGLEKMKTLVGTWMEADKDGNPTDRVVSVIKLTAGGSAVHETIFPDQPMEMVSVYTAEGPDVLLTHYCLLGNQPRMKADLSALPKQIQFKFDGGTNLDVAKDMHMHGATLTFVDDDHITSSGEAWVDGKPSDNHCGDMKLVRKK